MMRPHIALRYSVRQTFAKDGCKILCNTSHYPEASALELLKVVANDIEDFIHPEPRTKKGMKKRNIIHAIPRNKVVAVYTLPYPHSTCHTHEDVVRFVQSANPTGVVLLESMLRSRARVTLLSL